MKPESLVQLVGSGNTATVEEEWMRLVEAADAPHARIADYGVVLAELLRAGRPKVAEELAWAAIEAAWSNDSPAEALAIAHPFLLIIGESDELRGQAVELYRLVHAGAQGLDELLLEAGLGGGRPVRRALRTLDVCLGLKEGQFLAAREEDGAARVDRVDCSSWVFSITTERGAEELDAVHLADRYKPVDKTDFQVVRHFDSDELAKRLQGDPASVVIDICRCHGDEMDSDRLEMILVPRHLKADDWKKWWTRARTALKKCPNIKLDGRTPYNITYLDKPIALEDTAQQEFDKERNPAPQLQVTEKYLRECKTRGQPPSGEALARFHDSIRARAVKAAQQGNPTAGLLWVIARRIGELGGIEGAADEALALFKTAPDLAVLLKPIESEALLDLACDCLIEARPDDWSCQLLTLIPTFPLSSCNRTAGRLVDAGRGQADFAPVVQEILADSVEHYEALLWLWDGPSIPEEIIDVAPLTILSRILRLLEECRRSDEIPKQIGQTIAARAKSVLSARKFERFLRCIEPLEQGMVAALRTKIRRVENLGRAVREDMLSHISRCFPALFSQPVVEPWAREDVLYVTSDGLARRQREIEHLVNVKMRENARAIGEAAARGDLSENSEYKFALEERDLLRGRLAQMNHEVAKAQVIDPAEVPTDHVGIGTKVTFKRLSDGAHYEMSFAGPWEADPERAWLNYLAPLSQKIMGKCIGDTIELDHAGASGTYEVAALGNALLP